MTEARSTFEFRRGDHVISTDRARLDQGVIHAYLSQSSYWARGRPLEAVRKSIERSLYFGVYAGEQLIDFARIMTDLATFAWLCDVSGLDWHRGQGPGKWLVECVVGHPAIRSSRMILATRDAHELYRRHGGFQELAAPDHWMARTAPEAKGIQT